jgi:hypothetical protein
MKHSTRDWTPEEYDAWAAASGREEAVAEAADEEGGPRLSLVPLKDRDEAWPTDLLPPAIPDSPTDGEPDANASAEPPIPATPFDGVPLEDSRNRLAGWCAERQRLFLVTLAETGSVHLAAAAARLSARSAYRLRARSPAFAAGWDTADQLAVMWLLARLDPRRFAAPWELRKEGAADPQAEARESFPALLDALSDTVAE